MNRSSHSWLNNSVWFITRLWVWLPAILILLFVVALILLPTAVRWGAEKWLTDQGAQQVRIGDVDINLFLGQMTVRQLQFKTGDQRALVVPFVDIQFALRPLWRRQIIVEEIYLRDTALAIEQTAEGEWRFPGFGPSTAPPENTQTAWHVELRQLQIRNSELKFSGPDLAGSATIENAAVSLAFRETTGSLFPVTALAIRLQGLIRLDRAKAGTTLQARVNGDLKYTASSPKSSESWRIDGMATIEKLALNWPEGKFRVLSAEQIRLENLTLTGTERMSLGTLTLAGVVLAQPIADTNPRALLTASEVRTNGWRYQAGKSLAIEDITAHGFTLVTAYEAPGNWHGLSPLRAYLSQFEGTGSDREELPIHISAITLAPPAVIDINDQSVKPAYQSTLSLTRAKLSGLDTGRNPSTPATLELAARIGKFATAEINGTIRALTPDWDATLMLKTREFEMPPLTVYTAKMLGYRLVSGQMKGDLNLEIARGKLDGKSQLSLAKLSVKPVDDAAAEKMRARLSIPLETGLAMLRDKNDVVNLEVNISGDARDPEFDLTDAIQQALTKALRTASVAYLKHYFQPFGTLITVAELAGKAMQLRLEPLEYAAGSTQLTPASEEYLNKIGKLLQDRTQLGIKLCGKSVASDGMTAEPSARALAADRGVRLKEILISRFGIASDRLFLCEPELDKSAGAKPRVDLLL